MGADDRAGSSSSRRTISYPHCRSKVRAVCARSCASPTITGWQTAVTSSSATAFRTTSGPIPEGSPIVMPTRGNAATDSADSGFRVSIKKVRRRVLNYRRAIQKLRFAGLRQSVFDARRLWHALICFENVFDVTLQHEEV